MRGKVEKYIFVIQSVCFRLLISALIAMLPLFVISAEAVQELERPIVSVLSAQDGELYLQGDYVSSSLDFANYASKAPGSAKLDHYKTVTAGVRYAVTDALNVSYRASYNDQLALRTTEPKRVPSRIVGHDARLQYIFYQGRKLRAAVDVGYLLHQAKDKAFYRYDFGTLTVTRTGGRPLFTVSAKDSAWMGALRTSYIVNDRWRVHLGAELRRYDISIKMDSDAPTIRALLASEAPQLTPWVEYHAFMQLGVDWRPFKSVTMSVDYAHINIQRQGYIARVSKPDVNAVNRIDAYLFWDLFSKVTLYGHGRITDKFLLGDMPLLYNTRSNHKFNNAFGYVSAGLSWNF